MEGQCRLFSLRMRSHPTSASKRATWGLRGETSVWETAWAGDQRETSALTQVELRRAWMDSDGGGRMESTCNHVERGQQLPWDGGTGSRGTRGVPTRALGKSALTEMGGLVWF